LESLTRKIPWLLLKLADHTRLFAQYMRSDKSVDDVDSEIWVDNPAAKVRLFGFSVFFIQFNGKQWFDPAPLILDQKIQVVEWEEEDEEKWLGKTQNRRRTQRENNIV
jgi:hypothetical protein